MEATPTERDSEAPLPDSEREHLLGQDARSAKSNQSRNNRIGPQIAWAGTILAALNFAAYLQGMMGLEFMLYVWSILVTISFFGWAMADGQRAKASSVGALLVSFIPFIGAMLYMFWVIMHPSR